MWRKWKTPESMRFSGIFPAVYEWLQRCPKVEEKTFSHREVENYVGNVEYSVHN